MTEINVDKLLGQDKVCVKIGGKDFFIQEITTKKIVETGKAVAFFSELKTKPWTELLNEHGDRAVDFIVTMSGIDKETLMETKLSEMIEVVDAVLEANKDSFFLALQKRNKWIAWIGAKFSNTSSKKDTTSTT